VTDFSEASVIEDELLRFNLLIADPLCTFAHCAVMIEYDDSLFVLKAIKLRVGVVPITEKTICHTAGRSPRGLVAAVEIPSHSDPSRLDYY
jgi:hypothetical protein